ncbi:hypothetical protein CTEN210_09737 [Chaetoceros tenuissimus]|uniref:Uncharacterized protein n=1 Tax=Chaetoceros tenuissimus TaxID=426638 RepID=A0AAD3CW15_9STRA|nr:hypothetical protein CTEN210_09737 [Chaetoceros tenuissimus]
MVLIERFTTPDTNKEIYELNIRAAQQKLLLEDHVDMEDLWQNDPSKNYTKQDPVLASFNVDKTSPIDESLWLLDQSIEKGNATTGTIPKIIHKIYIEEKGTFPTLDNMKRFGSGSLEKAHASWKHHNPGYEIRMYNLHACRDYLRKYFHPVFLRAFDCLQAFSNKVNFMRMALVYREGGWYSDWKQECLQEGLLDKLASNVTLYTVWDRGNDVSVRRKCMQNNFFGAVRGHPLIAIQIRIMMEHIQQKYYGQSTLHATGPCAFGMAFQEYEKTFPELKKYGRHGYHLGDLQVHSSPVAKSESLILHKCKGCGSGQAWLGGNNYNDLFAKKAYYCADAPSIFSSVE